MKLVEKVSISSGQASILNLQPGRITSRQEYLNIYKDSLSHNTSRTKAKMIDTMVCLISALKYAINSDSGPGEKLSSSKSFYFRLNDHELIQKAILVELLVRNNAYILKGMGISTYQIQTFREKLNKFQYTLKLKV